MPLIVKCPICSTSVEWSATSLFKPFCSERCKLIDLGDWASEKHSIPVKNNIDPDMLDDMGYDEEDFFKQ
ncbi:DNA gyrase inhibitor YacG [Shewanella sp.]|uniref:DNA gyrase inhibitor YacG n=1 Tax=Shewanella sp. TaxID=50422 RepID=UPI004047B2AC